MAIVTDKNVIAYLQAISKNKRVGPADKSFTDPM